LITVYTDGSPNRVAVHITHEDGTLDTFVREIEFSTNFEAEYQAIIEAMYKLTGSFTNDKVILYNDSAVVIAQLRGKSKVRAPNLIKLYETVQMLRKGLRIEFQWVKRDFNKAGHLL